MGRKKFILFVAHGTGGRPERPSSVRGEGERGDAARKRSGGQRRHTGRRVGGGADETGGGGVE